MKKGLIILLHIGYWLLYLFLLLLFLLFLEAGTGKGATPRQESVLGFFRIMGMMTVLPALISFYFFYHVLFPKFLATKKIVRLCIAGLGTIFISAVIGFIAVNSVTSGSIFKHNGAKEVWIIILFISLLCFVHGIIALVMKGFINWYADIKIKQDLQQKNYKAEIALIKLQLNPHFLFNTINNIDVLIEKDAVKASAYLNKLSDIMRFMLYETTTEDIALEKELSYITKYIELQKIRYANVDFVQYSIAANPGTMRIAPMLFISFIENAFKHASGSKKQHGIVIKINIIRTKIFFNCKNEIGTNASSLKEAGGLGNELVRKRLQLLYKDKHQLDIIKDEKNYEVQLMIDTVE